MRRKSQGIRLARRTVALPLLATTVGCEYAASVIRNPEASQVRSPMALLRRTLAGLLLATGNLLEATLNAIVDQEDRTRGYSKRKEPEGSESQS